ncbi:MAG TPA: hypothetical protein VHM91_18875, partial [Verrucomicrobiales bacterium]|nr:hypothetical protein [Verrucomicrobiales bacterium]
MKTKDTQPRGHQPFSFNLRSDNKRSQVSSTGWIFSAVSSLLLAATASSSSAAVTQASSSGVGFFGQLSVAGVSVLNSGELAKSSGNAPPAYTQTQEEVPLNISQGLGLISVHGSLQSSAASNVDGNRGTRTTSASGKVNNFSLAIADLPLLPALIELGGNGTIIGSQGQISGDGVIATVTASSTISNLTLSISGQAIPLPVDPAPNTVIGGNVLGLAGATLYLNEQTPVTGSSSGQVVITALRLKLDGVNAGTFGLLSGEFKVGVSTATQSSNTDSDGDGVLDGSDADADGDGIPNATEIANAAAAGGDTDKDGIPDHLDLDSDNDGINDVIEAGGTDANNDGRQDGTTDADHDGIVDSIDPSQGGTALPVPDTDGDGMRDYLDVDSDNDGISDLVESGNGAADTNNDGVANGSDQDGDGIVSLVDGSPSWGDGGALTVVDSDGDGIPDSRDPHSHGPGSNDIAITAFGQFDQDNDGVIDTLTDTDHDGIPDVADEQETDFGGLGNPNRDEDGDGIPDGKEGGGLIDTDGDGVPDSADLDSDADGIPDAVEFANAPASGDTDGDGIVDWRDLDSDNDGINDVYEGGGTDANNDGRQDGTADVNHNGLVDTIDPAAGGTPLTVPDSDGDGAKNYIDLDSDNDTVSDLLEGGSGASDANRDGIVDGVDTDKDGIQDAADGLVGFGDANGRAPTNTDGTDVPDYIDTDSDNAGGPDIVITGNGIFDTNGDGRVDGPFVDPDHDGVDAKVDTLPNVFGGTGGCAKSGDEWRRSTFTAAEMTNPAISGWNADPDSDGLSNTLEYVFGTDPKVPNGQSPVEIAFGAGSGGGVTLSIPRDKCTRSFIGVETSPDLTTWTYVGSG